MASLTYEVDTTVLDRLIKALPAKADAALRAVAESMVSDVKLSFGTGPSGRAYRRRGVRHIASAPPGPPANDTGALRASIRWMKIDDLHYRVTDGVSYGVHLELGNTRGMAPRPFMAPVIEQYRQRKLAEIIRDWGIL